MKVTIEGKDYDVDFNRAVELGVLKLRWKATKIGTYWRQKNGSGIYIICQTAFDEVALINVSIGNRFSDRISVRDSCNITYSEFDALVGSTKPEDWYEVKVDISEVK
jgi:hypothetical protein